MIVSELYGLNMDRIREIREKLDSLGLELEDIIEYMDRDKVILFAEMKSEIKRLNSKIEKVKALLN